MTDTTALPPGVIPLAVPLPVAAALISVSPNHFLAMVGAGLMPLPRKAGSRVLWVTDEIRAAVAALPSRDEAKRPNSWDDATPTPARGSLSRSERMAAHRAAMDVLKGKK